MTDQPTLETPPGFEVPAHRVDREIYAMPAFTTLPVRDRDTATNWYEAMGFVVLAEMGIGRMRLVHLRRYRYQDVLLVPAPGGERPPEPGDGDPITRWRAGTGFAHTGPLAELDDIARGLRAIGTGTVSGPTLKPWHAVELDAVDADGHRVTLTARADTPPPPELADQLRMARPD